MTSHQKPDPLSAGLPQRRLHAVRHEGDKTTPGAIATRDIPALEQLRQLFGNHAGGLRWQEFAQVRMPDQSTLPVIGHVLGGKDRAGAWSQAARRLAPEHCKAAQTFPSVLVQRIPTANAYRSTSKECST